MSVQIKNLTIGSRTEDMRSDDPGPGVKLNRIPLDNKIYDLYVPTNSITTKKAAIIKSLRIINTHTAAVLIDLYYTDDVFITTPQGPSPSTTVCRRRRIAPGAIRLAPGFTYIDTVELAVEPGGRIQGSARLEVGGPSTTLAIDYVISGVERDVT